MDYQSALYDPLYNSLGVAAQLLLPTGETFELTVIDKTSGIEIGDGVQVATLLPAAAVRMAELREKNVPLKRLDEQGVRISFNNFTWEVPSYRLRPSPKGENDGEVYLLLSEKKEGETMTPGVYDFDIWRGSTEPFVVRLKTTDEDDNEVNLPFDDVRLTFYGLDDVVLFRKTLEAGEIVVTNEEEAEVSWTPTPEESRQFPLGAKTRYELEVRDGSSQMIYLVGVVTGAGGGNDD